MVLMTASGCFKARISQGRSKRTEDFCHVVEIDCGNGFESDAIWQPLWH